MYQLKRISYRHRAIIDWMLRHPEKPLAECARELGFSQSWLSIVTGSDLFREEYERRRAGYEADHDRVIRGKAMRLANEGLDRMIETVGNREECDPRFAQDATETALKALGYLGGAGKGGGTVVNVQQNNAPAHAVSQEDIREAQEIMATVNGGGSVPVLPANTVEGEE